ncbi:MAG: hypothetical protein WA876_17015 [Candidatus Acidiferrales bacterium]
MRSVTRPAGTEEHLQSGDVRLIATYPQGVNRQTQYFSLLQTQSSVV